MPILIAYTLNEPGQNYHTLYKALVDLGAKWVQGSIWLYNGPQPPAQIRDSLAAVIDINDDLLVTELGGRWATFNSWAARRWLSVGGWFGRLLSR